MTEIPASDTADFRPIEDYALIGDSRSAALVSRDGSIDWLCWPRFDSPAIFSGLLDPGQGGHCAVRPAGAFRSERRYEADSNVLVTTFRTASGEAQLTDLFFATSEARKRGRLLPQAMVIRRVECLDGALPIEIEVDPRPDFGMTTARLKRRGHGSWTFPIQGGLVHVASDTPLTLEAGALRATISLRKGETVDLVLALNGNGPAVYPPIGEVPSLIRETTSYWQRWSRNITYAGPHRDAVVRSALVLKLLTYAPSGAVIAAPTTSLPERVGATYNWDYRFCWLRDASDTVDALLGLGLDAEAKAFFQWMLHSTRLTHPELQIMYSVLGKPALDERELRHLRGYEDSHPVRIGNAAHGQLQLDVYGEVIRTAAIAYHGGVTLSGDEKDFLRGLASFVLEHWQEADSGIWETRGPLRHFVHSKVMCWVALDRILRLAEAGQLDVDAARIRATAAEIAATVEERGFNETLNSYAAALDGSELDAAVLNLPLVGFEHAHAPRMAATINTISRALSRDGLVARHQNDETGGEGAFLLCSFWLAQCLALQGRTDDASALFDDLCARANDVGLFSEEIDPRSGRFLGNFPQAFTHIGLIKTALALQDATAGGGSETDG